MIDTPAGPTHAGPTHAGPTQARPAPAGPGVTTAARGRALHGADRAALAGFPRAALARAAERARAERRPVLVSQTIRLPAVTLSGVEPIDWFERGEALTRERFYWERPADGLAVVGLGVGEVIEASGTDRFAAAGRRWRGLLARAILVGDEESQPGAGPLLVGGFGFDPTRPSAGDRDAGGDGSAGTATMLGAGAAAASAAAEDAPPATRLWGAFGAGRLVLPRLTLTRAGGACWLVLNLMVEPGADPEPAARQLADDACALWRPGGPDDRPGPDGSKYAASRPSADAPAVAHAPAVADVPVVADAVAEEAWKDLVARAVRAIEGGAFEKVVLARAVDVRANAAFAPARVLRQLRAQEPECAVFAVSYGERCFVGATPEQLARLRGDRVQVDCLAGTMRRGQTPEDDRVAGAALMSSAKERAEHAVVVRLIRGWLADACVTLDGPAEPRLRLTRRVQHLHTPLAGQVTAGVDVLGLVERLHPTPAVGGAPREAALAFIREHEGFDRGWYAGPIGWVDRHGGGDFVVGIRSALLHGRARAADAGRGGYAAARLFAGCGIVAASDPASELAEAGLKLLPMLTALRYADA